jgi:NADH dehydrogenase
MEMILAVTERRRLLVPVPFPLAALAGAVLQYLPKPLLTADQVRQLRVDNVVSEAAVREKRTFAAFGIEPDTLAAVLPTYLTRFRARGQFERRSPA